MKDILLTWKISLVTKMCQGGPELSEAVFVDLSCGQKFLPEITTAVKTGVPQDFSGRKPGRLQNVQLMYEFSSFKMGHFHVFLNSSL